MSRRASTPNRLVWQSQGVITPARSFISHFYWMDSFETFFCVPNEKLTKNSSTDFTLLAEQQKFDAQEAQYTTKTTTPVMTEGNEENKQNSQHRDALKSPLVEKPVNGITHTTLVHLLLPKPPSIFPSLWGQTACMRRHSERKKLCLYDSAPASYSGRPDNLVPALKQAPFLLLSTL